MDRSVFNRDFADEVIGDERPRVVLTGLEPVDSHEDYAPAREDVGSFLPFDEVAGAQEWPEWPEPPEGDSAGPRSADFMPAMPAGEILTVRDDWHQYGAMLIDDACGLANCQNGLLIGGWLAASIAIRQDLDGEVRANVRRHPERWGDATHALGVLGEPQYQIPAILLVYGCSIRRQDEPLHDMSMSLVSAYTLTGLSTLAVKGIANTDRPSDEWNDGRFGFPSYHVASLFAMAAVFDEYYGPRVGLPSYALAGLVGWSRIDEQDHDLSDVLFGSALGYVIGKSVAGRHLTGDSRVHLLPYVHPTDGSSGVMLDWSF